MQLPIFKTKAFLAPMAGISDSAFRKLAMENGAALCVTELTSVHYIVSQEEIIKKEGIKKIIDYDESESPRSIQLFGNDIEIICKAAKIIEPFFDIIDFNMGCPAKHITSQMAGAALLDRPEHIKELLARLVNSVNKPITLKIRMGIDNQTDKIYREIGKIAEKSGVSMITLHARTLKQGYSGKSNWDAIKDLKKSVSIPVCGNGDIFTPEDAKRMIDETGCDYIMIGRGALGNLFLFKQIDEFLKTGKYNEYTQKERLDLFMKYLEYSKEFNINFNEVKYHSMHYTKGISGGAEIRRKLSTCKDTDELISTLAEIENNLTI